MNNLELIKQTVLFGSVYEALEHKIFSCNELITVLAQQCNIIPRNKLIISFTILMNLYPSSYLYYNRKHLLHWLPQDKLIYYIYLLKGGSSELPINQDEPSSDMLWLYLFDCIAGLNTMKYDIDLENAFLFCDKHYKKINQNYEYWCLEPLFFCRCHDIQNTLRLSEKNTNEYYIRSDWFDALNDIDGNKFPYVIFFERCKNLITYAPLYFEKLKYKFEKVLTSIKVYHLEKFDKDLIKLICQCFPEYFSSHLLTCDEKYLRLCTYPVHIRAYLLGFPIERYIPSTEEIDIQMKKLMEIGIEEYVKTCDKNSYNHMSCSSEYIANTEDTLCEDPSNYYAFDRYDLLQNNKVYRFSRKEFSKLIEEGMESKNFWNQCRLPEYAVATMSIRNSISNAMNLPNSDTAINLLLKGVEGNLYQDQIEEQQKDQIEEMTSQQLLNLLSTALLNHHNM
jgi:hypothetical protein